MDFEVTLRERLYNFICPCWLPTRIKDESKTFIDNVELKLNHITNKHCLSVALGDLHPRPQVWFEDDVTLTMVSKIDLIKPKFGINKINNLLNKTTSYTDSIFKFSSSKLPLSDYFRQIWSYKLPSIYLWPTDLWSYCLYEILPILTRDNLFYGNEKI